MSRLVVDCSIAIGWLFEDQASRSGDAALRLAQDGDGHVPALWWLEVGNVLLVSERRRKLKSADSTRFLTMLRALRLTTHLEVTAGRFDGALELARRHGLTAYDAQYLALSIEIRAALASRDTSLLRAARAAGVDVLVD